MKLLVLAQTPPPVHGQSVMVQTLVEGLGSTGEIEVHHVNLALSHDAGDIGRWRPGKLLSLLRACRAARRTRRQHGAMALYYVPAPGKRSAVYRDWIVMGLCRRHFSHLILHWHASGLGSWLTEHATPFERTLTHRALGNADLSIVLSPALATDTAPFAGRKTLCIPNGLADPGPPRTKPPRSGTQPCELLYLGLCTAGKGLFDLLDALTLAHARHPGGFRLTVAGDFASIDERHRFDTQAEKLGPAVNYVGFSNETAKQSLFAQSDVFCFPTRYPHEGQPLVLIEAMARDLPIVATRWRAIPEMVPANHSWLVAPGDTHALADALCAARSAKHPAGMMRTHYLAQFTRDRHLTLLREAIHSLRNE